MGQGREFSEHQRKIINRYYEHRDTITLQKLSELVSDLYFCTDEKKAAALWKSVATALKNAGPHATQAARVLESRDVKKLAQLITELQSGKK